MSKGQEPVAAIDLGTNTFNLLIIKNGAPHPELLLSTKEGVALGMGGINDNRISEDAWQRGMDCLGRFMAICKEYGCTKIQAIATSAIRNAINGKDFVHKIEEEFDIPCKVIDGIEEAKLIYKGVCLTHNFDRKGLIMDIGGGSTEFILADENGILAMNSFEIGVSRIFQQFSFSDPFSEEDKEKINTYLEEKTGGFFDTISCSDFIGSSGSFETLYELLYDKEFPEGFDPVMLSRNEMEVMIDILLRMTAKERERHHRILPVRRKMIPIAAAKMKWIMEKTGTERIIITPCSLKEGVAFDLLNNQ
ncbi:hypothetical protein GCM10009118_22220 [Wandonia haliotis]|uniref:Ppx/GppA phosphatase N-terminal domain-containing protein n=1 Tax=Wandonia haliotis TaxID=574963 RepID=A0ABP3Y579_9FLAO